MMQPFGYIAIFCVVGFAFGGIILILSHFLAPKSLETKFKREPYECGEEPFGSARLQFKVGYYLFALLFLIFEVETLFLFPCIVIYKSAIHREITLSGALVFFEILVFIIILALGLIYAWKKKVLDWE